MSRRLTPAWVILGLLAVLAISSLYNYSKRNQVDAGTGMGYRPPFYERWMRKHEAYPYECWSDSGYDPTQSEFSRDVQLLAAMDYGKSDIDNGGFHQFFYNSTGVFAPEMVEWCERAGLDDVAALIRKAMATLTDGEYPRSREGRARALARFPALGAREQWDPFYQLDDEFYGLLSNNGSRYEEAANAWLRETCGVTSLDASLKATSGESAPLADKL